jgi:threonine dehydrogenase-like Zn-dependent dehydrogenase
MYWIQSVSLDDAQRVIQAGIAKANEIGSPSNIAVADAGGNLLAFARMQKAWLGSIDAVGFEAKVLNFGLGWSKSHSFFTGQTPVSRYNRQLMQAILHDRIPIADVVNAQVITLEEAPKGYADFDKGAPVKFILDPHGTVAKAA